MGKGFGGIGHCKRCGDTQGPWTLYPGIGWLCDMCADAEDRAQEFEEKLNWENGISPGEEFDD